MLQAFLHNKHHNFDETGMAVPLNDDSLIACVFGRLRYVPAQCVQSIFYDIAVRHACPAPDEALGALVHLHFWPRYVLDNQAYVEPHVVVEFERAVVLVQSALPLIDALQREQTKTDLNKTAPSAQVELASLRVVAAYEHKMSKLLLLGGPRPRVKSDDIWRLSWRNFFLGIHAALPQAQQHERQLVADIRNALELHGVLTRSPVYFTDFAAQCPRVQPIQPRDYLQGAVE